MVKFGIHARFRVWLALASEGSSPSRGKAVKKVMLFLIDRYYLNTNYLGISILLGFLKI